MGLRDEILRTSKKPRKVQKVEGEPWGMDSVYVLKMSGDERDLYQQEIISRCDKNGDMKQVIGWRAKVVVASACDKDGVKIFEAGDWKEVNGGDPDSIDLVFDAVREFNGLRSEDQEELRGNCDSEAGNGSSAASPSPSGKNPLDECLS